MFQNWLPRVSTKLFPKVSSGSSDVLPGALQGIPPGASPSTSRNVPSRVFPGNYYRSSSDVANSVRQVKRFSTVFLKKFFSTSYISFSRIFSINLLIMFKGCSSDISSSMNSTNNFYSHPAMYFLEVSSGPMLGVAVATFSGVVLQNTLKIPSAFLSGI